MMHADAHANACVAMPCPFPRPRPPLLGKMMRERERVGNAHTHTFFLSPLFAFSNNCLALHDS